MKRLFIHSLMALAMMGLLVACGGGSSEYAAEEEAEEMAAEETMEAEESAPMTAWSVVHEVEDFDGWLAAYEEMSDPETRGSVYRSMENPNLIAVFGPTTGHEAAKEMSMSDQLKTNMSTAGVTSDPQFTYFDIKWLSDETHTQEYRVLVSHEVADFAKWKEAFDSDEARRTEAGLSLTGMATGADNPNMVYMMFATADPSVMEEMMAAEDMKQVMEDAGVTSEPQASVWTVGKIYGDEEEAEEM